MAISKLAWTGTAKEATPGTIVQPPTKYIPTACTFKGGKKRVFLNEERGTRDANFGVVDSVRQSSIDMKGPFYPDVSPIQLWAGFGLPVSTVPTAGVNLHTFALGNVPPSYSISRNLDAKAYTVPYSVLEKWSLHYTVDGKLLELDSNWLGLFAQIYASPPTPTYSTVLPMAGHAPVIKFLDNVASNDISDLMIDFSQKITLWYGGNNNPDFVTVYFGERSMMVDLTARFDNDVLYQRWRNNVMDTLNFDAQGQYLLNNYTVSLGAPSAGTFTLTYKGVTTAGLAFNATGATVQTAFQGLSSVGASGATVTGSAGGPYTISFIGPLAQDSTAPTGSGAGLTGGTFTLVAAPYFNEINIQIANLSWDTMEHDTTKDNVLIKAKGTVMVPFGSSLVTGFVQNNVTNYLT